MWKNTSVLAPASMPAARTKPKPRSSSQRTMVPRFVHGKRRLAAASCRGHDADASQRACSVVLRAVAAWQRPCSGVRAGARSGARLRRRAGRGGVEVVEVVRRHRLELRRGQRQRIAFPSTSTISGTGSMRLPAGPDDLLRPRPPRPARGRGRALPQRARKRSAFQCITRMPAACSTCVMRSWRRTLRSDCPPVRMSTTATTRELLSHTSRSTVRRPTRQPVAVRMARRHR